MIRDMLNDWMWDNPVETEQYLALQAYLCFCSAFGCFTGWMQSAQIYYVYLEDFFQMGVLFTIAGGVLIGLADFRIPSIIWRTFITNKWMAK